MKTIFRQYRLGRKRWRKLLLHLERGTREAKRVTGLSRGEYQRKIKDLEGILAGSLNVIRRRGGRGPVRWPRLASRRLS
jgi:hypothetical protein